MCTHMIFKTDLSTVAWIANGFIRITPEDLFNFRLYPSRLDKTRFIRILLALSRLYGLYL